MPTSSPRSRPISWDDLMRDGWALWMEAGTVIWLRSLRLAAGGRRGGYEAQRMVSEKLAASGELAFRLMAAGPLTPEQVADDSIRHYRARVRANRRRLSRG